MSTLLTCWVTFLFHFGGHQQARLDELVDASVQLAPGDDEAKVLSVLGPPDFDWTHPLGRLLQGDGRRRWSYGATIHVDKIWSPDAAYANPLPIRLRLFGPDEDDLVIVWDLKGDVHAVVRP
jgi:hypothetical protein